jgi:deazaflavin-dependent oxidoreductase (nitroreductase family)
MKNTMQNTHSPRRSSPFWFMNKFANPFVGLILRSPMHKWLSPSLLLITYQGRKSGKKYTLPVQYVQSGNSLYIIPGAAGQKTWWRNLRGGAPVELLLDGHHFQAFAEVLTGEAHCGVIAEALKVYLLHFPAATRLHSIHLQIDGTLDEKDLFRAAPSVVLVRVNLK